MKHLSDGELGAIPIISMFLTLFPVDYLQNVLLKQVNKNLRLQKEREAGMGEMLRFIGIWFYMATFKGFTRNQFWSVKEIDHFDGAPVRLNDWMSKHRFDSIVSALDYMDAPRPRYVDQFFGIRQLLDAWNDNMDNKFAPSWINCLDESMSAWTSRWTCPGWMFVPRKPHPFGNEYNSICCGISGIMFRIELREGKQAPAQRVVQYQNIHSKTTGLLLRLCKPLAGRGAVVILDSGFCVLQGLIELKKIGVFASAVIKKRKYWPKYVPGDEVAIHMFDKEVGECDSLKGTLDGVAYDIFCLKHVDYVMKLMSTYGSLLFRLVP
jgi:hypothetical protein